MARHRHTEEEYWWPDALTLFDQLAAEGLSRDAACQEVADRFPITRHALAVVAVRGSIPAYPARDEARAKAWQAGEPRYDGKLCRKHQTRIRYSNDGVCVECQREYRAALVARRQNKTADTPAASD